MVNLSVSGARVADVAEDQLPQLAGLEPDLVTVAIGGNDVRSHPSASLPTSTGWFNDGLPAAWSVRNSSSRARAVPYVARYDANARP